MSPSAGASLPLWTRPNASAATAASLWQAKTVQRSPGKHPLIVPRPFLSLANTISLDIMASTSDHLEQGYEKIFRWCSYEFRQMGRDAQLEVGFVMREAVRRLRKRPELLTYVPSIPPAFQLTAIPTPAKPSQSFLKCANKPCSASS
jgi:hypothetical protein